MIPDLLRSFRRFVLGAPFVLLVAILKKALHFRKEFFGRTRARGSGDPDALGRFFEKTVRAAIEIHDAEIDLMKATLQKLEKSFFRGELHGLRSVNPDEVTRARSNREVETRLKRGCAILPAYEVDP